MEGKASQKIAFFYFVMDGHFVFCNFSYDFINDTDFFLRGRVFVILYFQLFLYYLLPEVLIEVFAVMELSTEVDEFLSLGLTVFPFSDGTGSVSTLFGD